MAGYKDGQDLLLGFMENNEFLALGHSTGCKISRSSETGERVTKENSAGKFKEKYVKSLSVSISADGFVYDYATANERGLPKLRQIWKDAIPVNLRWHERDSTQRYEEGMFMITSLEDDAQAGDDRKYSVTCENSGPVTDEEDSGSGSGSGLDT